MNRFQVGDEVKVLPQSTPILKRDNNYCAAMEFCIGKIGRISDTDVRYCGKRYLKVEFREGGGFIYPPEGLVKRVKLSNGKFFWLNTK